MAVTIGTHRNNPLPSNQFVAPTPAEGSIIPAQYFALMGGIFGADFQVRAWIFTPNVRYRQYVCGYYKYDGVPQAHALNGGNLHPMNFLEDGNANGVYGVLGQNIPGLSTYTQGNQLGHPCRIFNGSDTPSDPLECPSGTTVEMNLSFRGVLCDANAPHFTYVTRHWYVRGTFIKP